MYPLRADETPATDAPHYRIKILPERDFYVVPIVRYAFYAFIASIPFETVDLGIPLLEPTAITLGFLLLTLIFQIPLCLRRPPLAFGLFFIYLIVYAISVFTTTPEYIKGEAYWQLMVITQLVVMGWVAYNILKSEQVAKNALIIFAFSCTLLCFLQFVGVTKSAEGVGGEIERITALGFHPNNIARILVLGLLSIAGLAYAVKKSVFKSKWWVWGIIAIIGTTIVQTGSRGGLLALGAGLSVFVLKPGSAAIKFRNLAIVLIGMLFFVALIMQSSVTTSRFEKALDDGNLARREIIYPTAIEMIKEKPIFGWGAKTGEFELGAILAHPEEESKNAHNLILFVLVAVGIVGAVPLLAGLALTTLAAWRARVGSRGVLPLSLLTTVLIANMSGVWLHNKMHWIVVAYVLASAFMLKQKPVVRLVEE